MDTSLDPLLFGLNISHVPAGSNMKIVPSDGPRSDGQKDVFVVWEGREVGLFNHCPTSRQSVEASIDGRDCPRFQMYCNLYSARIAFHTEALLSQMAPAAYLHPQAPGHHALTLEDDIFSDTYHEQGPTSWSSPQSTSSIRTRPLPSLPFTPTLPAGGCCSLAPPKRAYSPFTLSSPGIDKPVRGGSEFSNHSVPPGFVPAKKPQASAAQPSLLGASPSGESTFEKSSLSRSAGRSIQGRSNGRGHHSAGGRESAGSRGSSSCHESAGSRSGGDSSRGGSSGLRSGSSGSRSNGSSHRHRNSKGRQVSQSGEDWHVVVRGLRPGVYKDKYTAFANLMAVSAMIRPASTRSEANQMFVNRYMAGEVKTIRYPFT